MKMIMAILHKDDELETIEELNIAGYNRWIFEEKEHHDHGCSG